MYRDERKKERLGFYNIALVVSKLELQDCGTDVIKKSKLNHNTVKWILRLLDKKGLIEREIVRCERGKIKIITKVDPELKETSKVLVEIVDKFREVVKSASSEYDVVWQ